MDHLQAIEMFVAVAGEGGFAAAARKLRISPPAVTRGIAALEARLGTALFHRSTRAVALTDAGSVFLGEARRLLAGLAEAERAVRGVQAEPSGQLFLTAPVMFGRLHVLPVVDALLTGHHDLAVRMMLIDRNVRIVEEGIDVAVRIGSLADSSLKAVRVGAVRHGAWLESSDDIQPGKVRPAPVLPCGQHGGCGRCAAGPVGLRLPA